VLTLRPDPQDRRLERRLHHDDSMHTVEKLREKLCRELAQSEHDAIVHCAREARRYGVLPPGQVLRFVSDHAKDLRPRLKPLWGNKQKLGIRAGRVVGEAFSTVRHFAVDWVIDAERSYRATLLGLRHGLDVARLLRAVLVQQDDHDGLRVCDELIEGRSQLLYRVEDRLVWFAEHPDVALRSARARTPKRAPAARIAAKPRVPRTLLP
jgi:hypothetical protein